MYDAGKTSVRVRVTVDRENPRTGEREHTCESRFVFVAVNADGNPVSVPELSVESDRDRELRDAGIAAE